jgi:ParB family chromosome partitioning protein
MTQIQKRRLGRGLAALIGDDTSEDSVVMDARHLRHVPIELLHPNPHNPRKIFREDDLEDLARSIRDKGLLQPLVVRPRGDGRSYEIVAGERRWRAAQRAGVHDLPVLIRELSDGESLEIALIENIQRSDLNAIEEARGYAQLINQFAYTQQQLAAAVGKSRSHIANTMRLLALPEAARAKVEEGVISAGHARALIATDNADDLAEQIIKLGMTVREAEQLARQAQAGTLSGRGTVRKAEKSADIRALEGDLAAALGLKVEVADKGRAGGQVIIRYKTLDQLDLVCKRLSRNG